MSTCLSSEHGTKHFQFRRRALPHNPSPDEFPPYFGEAASASSCLPGQPVGLLILRRHAAADRCASGDQVLQPRYERIDFILLDQPRLLIIR